MLLAVLPVINNTQCLSWSNSSPPSSLSVALFSFLFAFTLFLWEMSKAKRNRVSAQKCQYWQLHLSGQSVFALAFACVYMPTCQNLFIFTCLTKGNMPHTFKHPSSPLLNFSFGVLIFEPSHDILYLIYLVIHCLGMSVL